VTHYYGKIGVAIVELSGEIKIGDKVRVQGGSHEFDQEVGSMEVDRQSVETAKKGDIVGLKVNEKAPQGAKVHKLEEGE